MVPGGGIQEGRAWEKGLVKGRLLGHLAPRDTWHRLGGARLQGCRGLWKKYDQGAGVGHTDCRRGLSSPGGTCGGRLPQRGGRPLERYRLRTCLLQLKRLIYIHPLHPKSPNRVKPTFSLLQEVFLDAQTGLGPLWAPLCHNLMSLHLPASWNKCEECLCCKLLRYWGCLLLQKTLPSTDVCKGPSPKQC